ncbi:MAG: hypothetical protein ACJ79S_07075 [Gemmatimonadaceae bacterium]
MSAAYVYASAAHVGFTIRDYDLLWHAGQAMRSGMSPYDAVGPGLLFDTGYPNYYPLTAVVLLLPLAWLPIAAARAVFVGVSTALLGFAITRAGFGRLWMCASGSFLMAVWSAQWSPLLTAASILPVLGAVFTAKPNIGLALFAAAPTRRAAIAAAAFVVASIAVQPRWPLEWLATLASAPHLRAPLTHPAGVPLLLAALRWRRPEARLLLAMAAVPQNAAVYELLPLFAIPQGRRQMMLLAALSHLVLIAQMGVFFNYDRTFPIVLCYLPALVMVLRRPNEGRVPAPVERLASRLGAASREAGGA